MVDTETAAPFRRPRAPTITVDTSAVSDQNGTFLHFLITQAPRNIRMSLLATPRSRSGDILDRDRLRAVANENSAISQRCLETRSILVNPWQTRESDCQNELRDNWLYHRRRLHSQHDIIDHPTAEAQHATISTNTVQI